MTGKEDGKIGRQSQWSVGNAMIKVHAGCCGTPDKVEEGGGKCAQGRLPRVVTPELSLHKGVNQEDN